MSASTSKPTFIERFNQAKNIGDAISVFREVIESHSPRIERSRKKINDIYAGITPSSPYVEFAAYEGIAINQAGWADTKYKSDLNAALQCIIQELERLPNYDYIPSVWLHDLGGSGYICGLFGTEFINHGGNGIEITKHAISTADEIKNLEMPDMQNDAAFKNICEYAGFLGETLGDILDGGVDIVYPQIQGASTNSLRVLPEEEGLISVLTEPEEMEKLALMVTRLMTDLIKGLHNSAGGPQRFRPRSRFGAPQNVKGLMVDDWISVMSPSDFKRVYASSYKLMSEELGDIFLHTCGPVLHIADLLAELEGLAGLETVFVSRETHGMEKTTEDLLLMKKAIAGRYTIGSVGLPDGAIVRDGENFSPEFMQNLSSGGRFMFQASGSLEYAKKLSERLGIL